MSDKKDAMGDRQKISLGDLDRARARAGWPVVDGPVTEQTILPEAGMTPNVLIGSKIPEEDKAIHPGSDAQAKLTDELKTVLNDQDK